MLGGFTHTHTHSLKLFEHPLEEYLLLLLSSLSSNSLASPASKYETVCSRDRHVGMIVIERHGQPLRVTDTQYHWRFYKPRPTRDLTAEAVWDSWPPNLRRIQGYNYTDEDDTPPPQDRSPSRYYTPSPRQPTPSTPLSHHHAPPSRELTPLSREPTPPTFSNENQNGEADDEERLITSNINPMLTLQDPAMVKTKGRPRGAH